MHDFLTKRGSFTMGADSSRSELNGPNTLRGLTLLSMCGFHACWDLVHLSGLDLPWYDSAAAYWWQQSICWSFILISGFCWPMGHHHLRRGLLSFCIGGAITAASLILMPEEAILFGVLTFLGTATLLTIPCDRFLQRVPRWLGLLLCAGLFFVLRGVNEGYLGFEGIRILSLPSWLFRDLFTAALGFPPRTFASADYFSLLPWLFLFWTGYFFRKCLPADIDPIPRIPIISAMGRHSFILYLLHQPIIYCILLLLPL